MYVPEFIKNREVECKCGCGIISPRPVVMRLYAVRLLIDVPLIINSAIRCYIHNANIGGLRNSAHLPDGSDTGAFDIVAESKEKHKVHEWRLIQVCQFVGFTGIGIRDNTFIHIDDRHENNSIWGYAK